MDAKKIANLELKAFYRYRVSKTFFTKKVIRKATNVEQPGVAIVALYPRGPILRSATRLITSLVKSNYHVIAVVNMNQHSQEWIAQLTELNITVIQRLNIGRDFGAYKIGYLYALENKLLKGKQHLLFANDSVYYGPASEEFTQQLLRENYPWLAMFVNMEVRPHAQSFFLRFEHTIFEREEFTQFWKKFRPSERRNHNIFKGEIFLSELVVSLGYQPHSFVGAEKIFTHERFGTFTENEKHLIRIDYNRKPEAKVALDSEQIEAIMRKQFSERNVTLSQGTLASRVLGAPLKLDLDHRFVTQESIRDALIALGCSKEEAHDTLEFMLTWSVAKPLH
jgi:hypothetical protein